MAAVTIGDGTRTEGRIRLRSGVWLWTLVPQGAGRAAMLHLVGEASPEDELHVELEQRLEGMTDADVARAARFAGERVWAGPGGRQWKLTEVPFASPRTFEFQCDGITLRVRASTESGDGSDCGLGDLSNGEIADLLGTALVNAAAEGAGLGEVRLPWTARRRVSGA